MMEENGSDNAGSFIGNLSYTCLRAKPEGGVPGEGLSAPLRMEMNELVRDICMTLHISRATLYRYINTGGNA